MTFFCIFFDRCVLFAFWRIWNCSFARGFFPNVLSHAFFKYWLCFLLQWWFAVVCWQLFAAPARKTQALSLSIWCLLYNLSCLSHRSRVHCVFICSILLLAQPGVLLASFFLSFEFFRYCDGGGMGAGCVTDILTTHLVILRKNYAVKSGAGWHILVAYVPNPLKNGNVFMWAVEGFLHSTICWWNIWNGRSFHFWRLPMMSLRGNLFTFVPFSEV